MPHRGEGPVPARIMLVGEAWGRDEDQEGIPFVGMSGQELNRMLHEAGITRSECFTTNVVNHRPANNDLHNWIAYKKADITSAHIQWRGLNVLPIVAEGHRQLIAEIGMVQPNVIVAFGNLALHALKQGCISIKPSGLSGIRKWRGSLLRADLMYSSQGIVPLDRSSADNNILQEAPKLIPSVHPAAVLRQWDWRAAAVTDLRRVKKHCESREYHFPKLQYCIRPSFDQVMEQLFALEQAADWCCRDFHTGEESYLWLELDLETAGGHIACAGIGWSRTEAICIPFICKANREGYWNEEEEAQIIFATRRLLSHPYVRVRLQNGLYDAQYTQRHWHFVPRVGQDTMISQHALFSDQPKALAYQASMYCEHYRFWKDEGKQLSKGGFEEQHWSYNCDDDVNTREVGEVELQIINTFSTVPVGAEKKPSWPQAAKVHEFQQAMFWPVLKAMNRGIRVLEDNSSKLALEIQEQISIREAFMNDVLGYPINIASPKQMMALFYTELGQPIIMTRAKKGTPAHPTCDDDALKLIGTREPLLRPITNCVADRRTLDKFLGDFILAKRDRDGRMRCSFNIGGSESGKSAPKTYRLSSSQDAFGSGANLQTIPSEKSKSVGKWDARQHFAMIGDPYSLPNLREMFGPDNGYEFFDLDLDRADLQVMAWDADEPMLKAALKLKADIHLLNVYILDAKDPPPLEELVETHPKYMDHRGPRKLKREFAKIFCHATDYLGKARTVAAHTARTVHETERAQRIYLSTYKGIAVWQQRIIEEVKKRRYVENKFGYRWYIFDRIDDSVMPEAVAWIPQSTVSIVINRIWMNLFQGCTEKDWQLDVDSLYRLFARRQEIETLLQVHDALAGQYPIHRREHCLKQLADLSQITIPYDDPLIIPTGVGTSLESWGKC